jgi:hypothetical protein
MPNKDLQEARDGEMGKLFVAKVERRKAVIAVGPDAIFDTELPEPAYQLMA